MNLLNGHNDARLALQTGAAGTAGVQRSGRSAVHPGLSTSGRRPGLGSITGMLDRIGCGWVVLSQSRRILSWNGAAETILRSLEDPSDPPEDLSDALWTLIGSAHNFAPGSLSWIVIRNAGDRPSIVDEDGVITPDGSIILALLDRQPRSGPNPRTLQKMFGLTGAETNLAMQLAKGDAPLEIAEHCQLSRTTIRTQLASLFAKTETRRQAELVALLGRISVLP